MKVTFRGEPLDSLPSFVDDALVEAIGDQGVEGEAAPLSRAVIARSRMCLAVWRVTPSLKLGRGFPTRPQRRCEQVPLLTSPHQLVDRLADLDYELARHLAAPMRSQHNRNLADIDPAVQRGLAHTEDLRAA
jgi:hypothetical protein